METHRTAQLDHSAEQLAAERRAKAVEEEAGTLQAHELARTVEAADSDGDSSGGSSGGTRASATKPAALGNQARGGCGSGGEPDDGAAP